MLDNNKLKKLPRVTLLLLRRLSLQSNKLTDYFENYRIGTVEKTFWFPLLYSLNLKHNRIGLGTFQKSNWHTAVFRLHPRLRKLNLKQNKLLLNQNTIAYLGTAFSSCYQLKRLKVGQGRTIEASFTATLSNAEAMSSMLKARLLDVVTTVSMETHENRASRLCRIAFLHQVQHIIAPTTRLTGFVVFQGVIRG